MSFFSFHCICAGIVITIIQQTISNPIAQMKFGILLNSLSSSKINDGLVYNNLIEGMTELSQYILNKALNTSQSSSYNISSNCYNEINQLISTKNDRLNFYTIKLIDDSSKNGNDLSTYHNCMTRKYNYNYTKLNTSFILIKLDKTLRSENNATSSLSYGLGRTMFGLCLPDMCSESEYIQLVNITYGELTQITKQNKSDILRLEILLMNYGNYTENYGEYLLNINYFKLIPFFYVLIHMIVIVFNIIPFCIWKNCFKNNNGNRTGSLNEDNILPDDSVKFDFSSLTNSLNSLDKDKSTTNIFDKIYNRKAFLRFKHDCYFSHNFYELFNYNATISQLNNDSGITYIKGLRGLSMIFYIFGNTFFIIFNSPVAIYGKNNFQGLMSSPLYWIFYTGIRYAPRVLLSCSGYCLFYKLMNYLDDAYEEIDESKSQTENKETNDQSLISNSDQAEDSAKISFNQKEEKQNTNEQSRNSSDIPFKLIFQFYCYQIHKYLLYILLILFIQFSLYDCIKIFLFGEKNGPLWEYFNKQMRNAKGKNIALELTSTYSFSAKGPRNEFFLNYFWLIENEIIFFILTSFILFIGYKYKKKVNIFFIIIIILTPFACYFLLIFATVQTNNSIRFVNYFKRTSWFYFTFNFGCVLSNPLYNYMYYLIGVFFGSLNYLIQKGITSFDLKEQGKPFLSLSMKFVKWYKNRTRKFLSISAIILMFFLFLISNYQQIAYLIEDAIGIDFYYIFDGRKNSDDIDNGIIHGFFFLSDIIITTIFVHIICFGLYIKGGNYINDLLSHSFWSIFNKLYFSFIIMINPTILYILLQSESRINFNIQNCLLYSFITFFFTFILSSIIYSFFEMPYKRFIKLLFNNTYMNTANEIEYSCDDRIRDSSLTYRQLLILNSSKDKTM